MTDDIVEVTQADRDAAVQYLSANDRNKRSDAQVIFKAITDSNVDDLPIVQAFARHRLASEARSSSSGEVERLRAALSHIKQSTVDLVAARFATQALEGKDHSNVGA